MIRLDLETMGFNDFWPLHEELTKILSQKATAEKLELKKRLAQLNPVKPLGGAGSAGKANRPRRKYPKVLPKYRNPFVPTETWSGRGKQPRWLVAASRSGHKLEEFGIAVTDASKKPRATRRP